jgi:hypothetical protein
MKTLGLTLVLLAGVAVSADAQQPPTGKPEEIPAEYKPPKGMCRIWLKDVPPKQQPAPTDCAAAVKNVPANGRVVWGDTEESKAKGKTNAPPNIKPLSGQGAAKPPILTKKPPGTP